MIQWIALAPRVIPRALHAGLTIATVVFQLSLPPSAGSSGSQLGVKRQPALGAILWPTGTERISFENLEGVILLRATAVGVDGGDTTGFFVVDTGAGYLALDNSIAARMSISLSGATRPIGLAARPLPRLVLGKLAWDQVDPMLTFDAGLIRRVTDRPVLGLVGQRPMQDRALWIDYGAQQLALVPAGSVADLDVGAAMDSSRRLVAALVSPRAASIPFRLVR